jgi:hypothetical protein
MNCLEIIPTFLQLLSNNNSGGNENSGDRNECTNFNKIRNKIGGKISILVIIVPFKKRVLLDKKRRMEDGRR